MEILHLHYLISFLQTELQPIKEKFEALANNDTISYDLLWLLFPEGSDIIFKDWQTNIKGASKVAYINPLSYSRSKVVGIGRITLNLTNLTSRFGIGQLITMVKRSIMRRQARILSQVFPIDDRQLPIFYEDRDIGSLEIQPLSHNATFKDELREMGRHFVSLKGRHFWEYDGQIIQVEVKPVPSGPPTLNPLYFSVFIPHHVKC